MKPDIDLLKQANWFSNYVVLFPLQAEFAREKHKGRSRPDSKESASASRYRKVINCFMPHYYYQEAFFLYLNVLCVHFGG